MPEQSGSNNRHILPALAMHDRYGPLLRTFFAQFFDQIKFPPEAAERIRALAAQGPLVYLARSANPLHFLYLNYLCLKQGFPLASFVDGVDPILFQPVSLLLRRMRTLGDESQGYLEAEGEELPKRQLAETLISGQSVLLYLDRPSTLMSPKAQPQKDLLATVLKIQTKLQKPITILPHLIIWNKHPEREAKNVADTIFGVPETPGLLRSLYLLLRYNRSMLIKLAEPITIDDFLKEQSSGDPDSWSLTLQRVLAERLSLEVLEVTGPRIRPPAEFKREILSDERIQQTIHAISNDDETRAEALRKQAHDQVDEIAAEPRILWPIFFDKTLNLFWKRMYEGIVVDEEGFDKIRNAIRRSPVVFCPSHKSHVDYLILSQLCLKYSLPLPHIAAGVNLSFWPLGPLFRHSGAFFLRRSFKGDALYPLVFRTYLRYVMKEGFPIEFFIEGTRSRTGKLLNPRFGILSWLIQAFTEGTAPDLQFIPISIDYEKVVESRAYLQELKGAEKTQENVANLVKSGSALKSKYGKIYVQIADPISLREEMGATSGEISLSENQRHDLTQELAHEILFNINQVATVTPSALLAFCLLTQRRRGVSQDDLIEHATWSANWIRHKGPARFSHTLGDFKRALIEAASRFSHDGLIRIQDTGFELVYSAVEERRLALDFYRNNLIHHFVPAGIFALALESFTVDVVPMEALRERIRELFELFRFEFLFRSKKHFEDQVQRAKRDLLSEGVIREEADFVVKVSEAIERRMLFRGALEHFVEAYWLAARSLTFLLEEPLTEKDLLVKAMRFGDRLYVQGELMFAESISREILRNAVQLFTQRAVIGIPSVEDRKGVLLTVLPPYHSSDALSRIAAEIERYLKR
jgi:glycerol-3-phosphate O-acyltransferase